MTGSHVAEDQRQEPFARSDGPSTSREATRILLVDDHPVVRQGIRQILTEAFDQVDIGEAGDAPQALHEVRTRPWSVVILDLSLPGTSGLDVLRDLRREQPALPILILSMHTAAQFAWRAMAAGAAGYLTKDSGPRELVRAVHLLLEGKTYTDYTDAHPESGAPRSSEAARRLHDALSDREYQVLRMMALGKTVSQIALETSLSVKTVSTYRARVLEKMGMRTTAELMRYAILNHLVD